MALHIDQKYTEKLKPYHTRLLDTKKDNSQFSPAGKGSRQDRRGTNHRFGLYDMIMLKDNHIDYCGGIEKAIEKAYDYVQQVKPGMAIEVETRSVDDVRRVMQTGKVNRIMLDNFQPATIREALAIIGRRYETEASGALIIRTLKNMPLPVWILYPAGPSSTRLSAST